jgi:hypothetical protein
MKTVKRKVYIDHFMCNYNVMYLERKKGGHHMAAGFNDVDSDLEKVIKWVKSQKNLELVDKPNDK